MLILLCFEILLVRKLGQAAWLDLTLSTWMSCGWILTECNPSAYWMCNGAHHLEKGPLQLDGKLETIFFAISSCKAD